MKLVLTYKLSSSGFSGHLLTAKKVEACIGCVLVSNDTQQPDSFE